MSFRSKYDPGVNFHASEFPNWAVYFGLAMVTFLLYVVVSNNKKKKDEQE